ncbi:golvesin C-terminal-like domain-containing protein, partial [Microbacterium sp. CPCC 204701]|uniref:golvesin C-terminal-like domain-containing protein n=1 Tax=Microbacterium sp. CPCC 204701 TaxID=2493084 RepID=UPI0013E330CA
ATPPVVTVQVTETTPRADGTVPFSVTGTWQPSAVTGPDGAPSRYSTSAAATATWTLPVAHAGTYRVEAGVPDAGNSESAAVYTVSGGSGASTTTTVDQNAERGAWTDLGSVELSAGETATVRLSRQATTTGINTRAASVRLVPDEPGNPGSTGLPFSEAWSGGTAGWTPLAGALSSWSVEGGEVDAVTIDNLAATSGSYLRPTAEINLPDAYTLRTSVRADQLAANGTVSLLVDAAAPYSHIARNTAIQITATGITLARPNGGTVLCTGRAPMDLGEWANVEITRANGILAVRVDSALVAAVPAGDAGGTIGFGAYRADARIGGIGVEQLDSVPAGHPATASGCSWTPSTGAGAPQPVVVNQSGYDLGGPKRFTAPNALDGESFQIVDASGAVVHEGTVQGRIGDFTDFDPAETGPFRILVHGVAGEGDSYEFGIGANWTERIGYDHAIAFMSDVRCFFGDLTGKPLNGTHPHCMRGLGWRDSHQMSFELSSLVDLYLANPTPIAAIRMPEAVYEGLQYPTAEGSPEIARLLAWGAEIYLRGQYDHVLVKEQLASFLWAYPELSEWIPRALYEDVRDYLFPIWSKTAYGRYFWHDYTPHTADLLQVYTQIGTGKGEFPPGHSIVPNLRMWEVAVREGRDDAELYRDAAIAQARWLIDDVDLADPGTTKGQRQGEYHLMTSLATLATTLADEAPDGIAEFAAEWAEVAIGRSANMWDFRRYSDDRWTIPSFTGGGSGEDPNESGNVLGFPAAALAATTMIDDPAIDARLTEIAQAHVDNVFGRNPTGRAAQYRINDPELAFEGLDLGWFSEYQGGYGLLQGAPGVFDGSPKNGHYPFNPGVANIGHTEGWVTFTTAWVESLAWRAFTSSTIALDRAEAPADGSVTVTLRAPLNMDAAGGNTGEVRVTVDGTPAAPIVVTQTAVNALDYTAELDIAALGAQAGDIVTVSHGVGSFARTAALAVTASADDTPPVIAGLPADGTLVKDSDTLRLAISAADPESGVDRLEVSFDGGPVAPDAEIDLDGRAGAHTVSVRAVNGADAAAEESVTVFVFADTNPTSAPGRGSLSNTSGHAYGLHDGAYDVVMNLWWGTPGAAFRLYENGELIATEVLDPAGGMSQITGASFTGKPDGTYVYTAELINSRGATATTSTTVKVVHAAPAAPVASHDDWDRDGSFTATANLWWGTNATSYRFELDGTVVGSGALAASTPEAQRVSVALNGVAAGTHTLVAVFANANGETASRPVTVTVR